MATVEIKRVDVTRKTVSGATLSVSGHMKCLVIDGKVVKTRFQENELFYHAFRFIPNPQALSRRLLIDNEN